MDSDGDQLGVGQGNVDPGEAEEASIEVSVLIEVPLQLHHHELGLDPAPLMTAEQPGLGPLEGVPGGLVQVLHGLVDLLHLLLF